MDCCRNIYYSIFWAAHPRSTVQLPFNSFRSCISVDSHTPDAQAKFVFHHVCRVCFAICGAGGTSHACAKACPTSYVHMQWQISEQKLHHSSRSRIVTLGRHFLSILRFRRPEADPCKTILMKSCSMSNSLDRSLHITPNEAAPASCTPYSDPFEEHEEPLQEPCRERTAIHLRATRLLAYLPRLPRCRGLETQHALSICNVQSHLLRRPGSLAGKCGFQSLRRVVWYSVRPVDCTRTPAD